MCRIILFIFFTLSIHTAFAQSNWRDSFEAAECVNNDTKIERVTVDDLVRTYRISTPDNLSAIRPLSSYLVSTALALLNVDKRR